VGTPAWLYYLFGVVMLALAAYSVFLLFFSFAGRHQYGRDVDVAHIFMGVSMAGMFVTKWAFGPRWMWELIFASLMVWFLVRSTKSIQRFGLHKPHEAIHAAMNFAMLLMYLYPLGSTGAATAMSMSMSSAGSKLDPGLGLLLVVTFFASGIFTLASPVKGASHHGTHAFAYAANVSVAPASLQNQTSTLESLVTTAWLEDASHVAMCVAMGFMLILMF
jgi:hypothetical protein